MDNWIVKMISKAGEKVSNVVNTFTNKEQEFNKKLNKAKWAMDLIAEPKRTVEVYDNGGKTIDRYTVIIDNAVFSMSHNATSPQGVNQYVGELKDLPKAKEGTKVELKDLPEDVRKAIDLRIEGFKESAKEYYWQDLPTEIKDELWEEGLKKVKGSNKEEVLDDIINRNNEPKTISEWQDFVEADLGGEASLENQLTKESGITEYKGFKISEGEQTVPNIGTFKVYKVEGPGLMTMTESLEKAKMEIDKFLKDTRASLDKQSAIPTEKGATAEELIEQDRLRQVEILSDQNIANMLTELELREEKKSVIDEYDIRYKEVIKRVQNNRKAAEKKLLKMIPEHAMIEKIKDGRNIVSELSIFSGLKYNPKTFKFTFLKEEIPIDDVIGAPFEYTEALKDYTDPDLSEEEAKRMRNEYEKELDIFVDTLKMWKEKEADKVISHVETEMIPLWTKTTFKKVRVGNTDKDPKELAESFINGNISHVREEIGNDIKLFNAVIDELEETSPDEVKKFRRLMVASLNKKAEVDSPWSIIKEEDKELIARVRPDAEIEKETKVKNVKEIKQNLLEWSQDKYAVEEKGAVSYKFNYDEISAEGKRLGLEKADIDSVIDNLKRVAKISILQIQAGKKDSPYWFSNVSTEVRWNMAHNPKTPLWQLKELSKDSHSSIRELVADNPNTPIEILKELSKDENPTVRDIAISRLEKQSSLRIDSKDFKSYKWEPYDAYETKEMAEECAKGLETKEGSPFPFLVETRIVDEGTGRLRYRIDIRKKSSLKADMEDKRKKLDELHNQIQKLLATGKEEDFIKAKELRNETDKLMEELFEVKRLSSLSKQSKQIKFTYDVDINTLIADTTNEIGEKCNGLIVKIFNVNEDTKKFEFDIRDPGDNETDEQIDNAISKAIEIMEKNLMPFKVESSLDKQSEGEFNAEAFGRELGLKAGKTDDWMDMEKSLEETNRDHGPFTEDMDLVMTDFEGWRETEHYQHFYLSKLEEKLQELGITGDETLDYYGDFESGFLEGYLDGRKSIGIDIYDIAYKLIEKKDSLNIEAKIVKKKDKWCVIAETGRSMGCYDSEAGAKKRLKQIEIFKHMRKKSELDKEAFEVGDIVEYKFGGKGDILKIEGDKATVDFGDKGIKTEVPLKDLMIISGPKESSLDKEGLETITITKEIATPEEAKEHIPAGSFQGRKDGDITIVIDQNAKEYYFKWDKGQPIYSKALLNKQSEEERKDVYEADADALDLLIFNERPLYDRYIEMAKNLSKKKQKGIFDKDKAAILFKYLADEAAKKWYEDMKQWADDLNSVVIRPTVEVRKQEAKDLVEKFEQEYESKAYDFMKEKESSLQKQALEFTEENIKKEMAEALKVDVEDITIGEEVSTNVYDIQDGDYQVAKDEESAEKYASDRVREDLENEPEIFNQDWLMGQIDEEAAEKLFTEIFSEWNDSYARDIMSENSDKYVHRLAEEMVDRNIITEEQGKDEDFDFEEKIDEFVAAMTEDQIEEGEGGISYYRDNFGDEEIKKLIKDNNLIDINEATEDAIATDGWQHFICSYDGKSEETKSGFVYWRIN